MNTATKVADLPRILRSRAETGIAHHGEAWSQGVRFAANQLESAISQQPSAVGVPEGQEPVAWTVQDQLDKVATGEVGFIARKDMVDPAPNVPLYTAPPAQAVDLWQFRRPLKVARTSMEWARNEKAVAECAAYALIDQQAGKGNDRAK